MKNQVFTGFVIVLLISLLIPYRAYATLALSDVPLFLTTAVDSNIMFTLDDSGSMQFEIMPEEKNIRWGCLYVSTCREYL